MDVLIPRANLVTAMKALRPVIAHNHMIHVMQHVMIQDREGGVTLTGSDLNTGLRLAVGAETRQGGTLTLNAAKLTQIANAASSETVRLRSAKDGWAEITAGGSKFKVPTTDGAEWPVLPFETEGATLVVSGATLGVMLDRCLFAATDRTRPNIYGVRVEVEAGTLRMVTTNGHRMNVVERPAPGACVAGALLDRDGCAALVNWLGDGEISLTIGKKTASLTGMTWAGFVQVSSYEFPDWRQVIPTVDTVARINRDAFMGALERAAICESERTHKLKLQFAPGLLTISGESPEHGEAEETIEAGYGGEERAVGFNWRYLHEALSHLPEDCIVSFGMCPGFSPALLQAEGDPSVRYVVMLMNLT